MSIAAQPARLVARTTQLPDPGPLLSLLPGEQALAWVRQGEGLVAWGEVARFSALGPGRFSAAETWWRSLTTQAVVRDEVRRPGTGPVAFGSFSFADGGDGTLVVPQMVVGRRDGVCWLTVISADGGLPGAPALPQVDPVQGPGQVTYADGAVPGPQWMHLVNLAVQRIREGRVDKVVMARDMVAHTEHRIDPRYLLARLAERYPSTWTFGVDALVGATPELLVRCERGLVTSRVLAGTIRRTGDDERDLALAGSLARSSKDLEEHEYAVRSVAEALAPYWSSANVPEVPFVLHLPNVMHLATDVTGSLDGDPRPSVLTLAAALHPTAAVCGTPTRAAAQVISQLERMNRGRYAGPVGWLDASGDGEFGIALRCAQLADDGRSARLFAGCGIVAGSDPTAELAESEAKLVPVRDALG